MKSNSFGMKSHPKGIQIYSLKVWKYTQRYENNVDGMKKYKWYQNDAQGMKKMPRVWKMCARYEKCAQGIKLVADGPFSYPEVRYVEFSWKTVGFHTFMGLFHTFLDMKISAVFPWWV